jgi:hypothetical protein
VTVEVPVGVFTAVATSIVDVPAPSIVAGVKVADALAGKPVADRLTVPVKPFTALTVTA